MIAHLDLETRSRVDLADVGAHRYAEDPSTEIFMAAVSADNDPEAHLWINPAFADAGVASEPKVLEILSKATLIYVHNAMFEKSMLDQKGDELGFPTIQTHQYRCTAAMARKAGLPWSLEKLSAELKLGEGKDAKGKALIRFFSIPDPKTGQFRDPKAHPEKWKQFCEYCRQDVRTERSVHAKLGPFELCGSTLDTFLFDLRLNDVGIPINLKAARNAQKVIDTIREQITKEFVELAKLNPTQRDAVKALLGELGCPMADMTADTVKTTIEKLEKDIAAGVQSNQTFPKALRILTLYAKLSYAAVKKVQTILDCVCEDGRIRGSLLYYGAGTGRWSGRLIQPQNFKKTPKWMRSTAGQVYQAIIDGWDAEALESVYGDPYELIAGIIRFFIDARPFGFEMYDGDYNAIEARIAPWLAGQEDALAIYREGDALLDSGTVKKLPPHLDRYILQAAETYEKPITEVTDDDREVGKRGILGLQYGMGEDKFQKSCEEQYNIIISKEVALKSKLSFRRRHKKIMDYAYFLEKQARQAIASPGRQVGPFVVRMYAGRRFLLFKLRSGRMISYPDPLIEARPPNAKEREEMANGREYPADRFTEVTYYGKLDESSLWGRIKIYSGKFLENETQATAADVMAFGAIAAERMGIKVFTLIHDQGLAEKRGSHTAQQFATALGSLPPWAVGLPLRVEAKIAPYYKK